MQPFYLTRFSTAESNFPTITSICPVMVERKKGEELFLLAKQQDYRNLLNHQIHLTWMEDVTTAAYVPSIQEHPSTNGGTRVNKRLNLAT